MPQPKRFLPPISALRALESFERTKNVSETGRELGLSQSAVSRQLKVLEDYLDTPLFVRDRKRITLTLAAQSYALEVRSSLNSLGTASLRLKANPKGGRLNLAILPAFGVRWLAPKLPKFVAQHPEVTVNLSTRLQPFDFNAEPFHAAIHFGQKDWPDVNYLELMKESVVAVASPENTKLMKNGEITEIFDLPLLHLETRPDAWERWAVIQGVEIGPPQGMLFDQFASMIQAAIHGLGAALVPTYLIEKELEEGVLVSLSSAAPISIGSYFFVWPAEQAIHQPRLLFEKWLCKM
ncbi:MAG: LysR family glycine cleavage system transcriptional activator [Gammaproteobacteria bacterium]|jgi:LysR family glycine cleavage system transcriptional activator